jgi:histidinol-phosphate aminotransferase
MATSINRRQWLKASAALSGAFTFAPGMIGSLSATPIRALHMKALHRYTEVALAKEFPTLKARLFANENPFGPSAKAKQALIDAVPVSFRYAIKQVDDLGEKIATHEGIKKEQLAVADGSTSLLHACAVLFSQNGGEIISGDPSYTDLVEAAEVLHANWIKVPLTKDYRLDLDAFEKSITSKTSLVYICNPNNPTGTVLETEKLRAFCERVSKKTTVFIDEAYIDYLGDPKKHSMIDLVKKGSNVIVARTFSKLYGFAGLRVGYIVAQEEMIKRVAEIIWPDAGLSSTSIAAASAGFQETDFLKDALKKTIASKEYLYDVLKKEGYEYIPSSTNFVMFPSHIDAERFVEEMLKRGVGVRPWKLNQKDYCRVSIGTMEEMEIFAKAFKEIS